MTRGVWRGWAIDNWLAQLKPDFESATTLRELGIHFWLDRLEVEITVFLRNGQTRRFIHWAGYGVDIP